MSDDSDYRNRLDVPMELLAMALDLDKDVAHDDAAIVNEAARKLRDLNQPDLIRRQTEALEALVILLDRYATPFLIGQPGNCDPGTRDVCVIALQKVIENSEA